MKKTYTRRARTLGHQVLSRGGIIVVSALVVASFVGVLFLTRPGSISEQLAAVVSARLVDLANSDRAGNGLQTLAISPVLTAAAQAKANDMAGKSYFAHTSPEGKTSWYWFKQAGYDFSYAGENLAVDFTDSDEVNKAWLNSPTHRANIMNVHFTQIGIATAQGTFEGRPTSYVVQMFGTPAASVTMGSDSSNVALVQTAKRTPTTEKVKPKPTITPKLIATQPRNPREPALAEVASSNVLGASVSAEPTQVQPVPVVPHEKLRWWQRLLSSPRTLLQDIYTLFALVLIIALLLRTRLEFRMHHARHAMATLLLLAVMSGLFITADHYIFVPPTIGSGVSQ